MTTIITIEPIEREAVTAKTFDRMWLTSLVVLKPSPQTEGKVVIEWQPMSLDGELFPQTNRIECDTLFAAIAAVPEIATAFNAVMQAVIPLKTYVETPTPEEENP